MLILRYQTIALSFILVSLSLLTGCADETMSMRNKTENKQELQPQTNISSRDNSSDATSLFDREAKDDANITSVRPASASAFLKSVGRSMSCMQMCLDNKDCKLAKAKSFCKWDQLEPYCFGLYWKDASRSSNCYFPSDSQCSEKYPVGCGVLKPIVPGRNIEAVNFLGQNKSCQGLCTMVSGCTNSVCREEKARSGYCTGLYWLSATANSRSDAVHDSTNPGLSESQRVACGVYNYTSELL